MVIGQKRKFEMLKKVLSLVSLAALSCQVSATTVSVPVTSHGCDLSVGTSCYLKLAAPLSAAQNAAGCLGYDFIRWDSTSAGTSSLMDTLSILQSEGKSVTVGLSDTECFFGAPQAVWWRNDNT